MEIPTIIRAITRRIILPESIRTSIQVTTRNTILLEIQTVILPEVRTVILTDTHMLIIEMRTRTGITIALPK